MGEAEKQKYMMKDKEEVNLVRILGKDIRGDKKVAVGLTKIRGISWAFSNALCIILNIDKNKKVQELSKEELERIENFSSEINLPSFLKNRQKDFDTGEDKHIIATDLRLREEFDIKRLRKIKSYKGNRHAVGLPVRGQRTKSNFRKNRKKSGAVGVKKKK